MIRVLIADDHAVVRTGFRLLLEEADDIVVVAEAESGEESVRLYAETTPDVVMLDIAMPGIGGIEAIKKILAKDKHARILVLVLKSGALGYLTKRQAPEVLIETIRKIYNRETLIDPELAQRIAVADASGKSSPIDLLSEREFNVFEKLALGKGVNDIAEMLNLSPSTVGTHLYNIKQKLDVSNQAEITIMAVRHGVIDP